MEQAQSGTRRTQIGLLRSGDLTVPPKTSVKWLGKLSPLAQASSRASATVPVAGLIKRLSNSKVKGFPPKSGPTIFNMAVVPSLMYGLAQLDIGLSRVGARGRLYPLASVLLRQSCPKPPTRLSGLSFRSGVPSQRHGCDGSPDYTRGTYWIGKDTDGEIEFKLYFRTTHLEVATDFPAQRLVSSASGSSRHPTRPSLGATPSGA